MEKVKRGNVRFESYTIKKSIGEVIHDLRYEKTIHMTNDENLKFKNVIFHKFDRKYFEYGHQENKKSIDKIKENILNEITEIQEEHKTLFKKYHKRSLREDRYNSINRGILTFENQRFKNKSESEKKKFIVNGKESIEKYCKEKGLKLLYIVYHDDEESGHFHFMTSNYYIENDKLKSLNIKKNKGMGKELQDFFYENFTKNFGYERGLSKELTKRKHQKLGTTQTEIELEKSKREKSIEKSKDKEHETKIQEKMNIIQNFLNENETLKKEKTKLNEEITTLKTTITEVKNKKDKTIKERNLLDLKLNYLSFKYKNFRERIINIKNVGNDIKKELHKFNKKIKDRILQDQVDETNRHDNKYSLSQTEKKQIVYEKSLTWDEFQEEETKLLRNIRDCENVKPYEERKLKLDLSLSWSR
ncbi:MAG: hypothetical protein KU29_01405 [Sulfurovum sp. FS06-10]|nr:MAG: hypothetical protein KU29_01405 [Sulfurovum sp. FS06-10]